MTHTFFIHENGHYRFIDPVRAQINSLNGLFITEEIAADGEITFLQQPGSHAGLANINLGMQARPVFVFRA
jgi:hypothetical protein